MSLFDNFFKSKQSTLSLNLESPNGAPSAMDQPAASVSRFEVNPELLHAATPVITERSKAMLEAGIRPVSFYLAIAAASSTPIVLQLQSSELQRAVLVFSSGFQATDYLRECKIVGGVHEFPATSFHSYTQHWKKGGADAFTLDRCPRCPVCLPIPLSLELTDEQVSRTWAVHLATRIYQGQRAMRSYMDTSTENDSRVRRKLLELIRDHLNCSIPYLHWMIALEAGMSKDEDVRLAAIDRLNEFGPSFHNKTSLSSDWDAWVHAAAECQMGLLGSLRCSSQSCRQP